MVSLLAACFLALSGGTPHRAVTLRSDTVDLLRGQRTVVVFAGSYACSKCYHDLHEAITAIDSTVPVIALLHVPDRSVRVRKSRSLAIRDLLVADDYLFDITGEDDDVLGSYHDGLFAAYGLRVSPGILILDTRHPPVYLGYDTLFHGTMPLAARIRSVW